MKKNSCGRSKVQCDFARFYIRGGLPSSPNIRDEIFTPIIFNVIKGVLCCWWLKLQVSTNSVVGDIVHQKWGLMDPT